MIYLIVIVRTSLIGVEVAGSQINLLIHLKQGGFFISANV
jgi:hypothetical protein